MEKILEIPVEQIIEIPCEKVIERPVEIPKYVQVPVERIVEKPYDVVREQVNWQQRYIDIDEKDLPKYPRNSQKTDTQVHYEYQDKIVEQPKYIDNYIERQIPIPV